MGNSAGHITSGPGGRPTVSPNSGLVHWVSMMADHAHVPSSAHSAPSHADAVHYMWNGSLEVNIMQF